MSIPDTIEKIKVQSIGYSINEMKLLRNIDFEIESNRINSIIGPNGSGKTLTNKILALLLKPDEGKVLWNNYEIPYEKSKDKLVNYRRKIGYMSQKPLFLNCNVEKNIEIPLTLIGLSKETRKKRVFERLNEFEFKEYSQKNPKQLSFGQQQKLSLIIATIKNPPILILDEPTANLDPKNTLWFENFITSHFISKDNVVLWTTHDKYQLKRTSSYVIFVINGTVLESGSVSILDEPNDQKVLQYLNGNLIVD